MFNKGIPKKEGQGHSLGTPVPLKLEEFLGKFRAAFEPTPSPRALVSGTYVAIFSKSHPIGGGTDVSYFWSVLQADLV